MDELETMKDNYSIHNLICKYHNKIQMGEIQHFPQIVLRKLEQMLQLPYQSIKKVTVLIYINGHATGSILHYKKSNKELILTIDYM